MPDVAETLATLLAEAGASRQRGEPIATSLDAAAKLAIELTADDDPATLDRFFQLLAEKLAAGNVALPPLDELPSSIAPVVAAFAHTFVHDAHGDLDFERTAQRAEREMERRFGTSTRKIRRAEQRARIKRDVAASVADAVRRSGLTPKSDTDDQ